jgi:hypothetical protein
MPWANPSPLALHHGTVDLHVASILTAIDVTHGRLSTDFSKGFYTTTNYAQAHRHALNMLTRLRSRGARRGVVLSYAVDRDAIANLRSLAFARATDDYWHLVDWCRDGKPSHRAAGYYDVVCGPVARNIQRRVIYEEYDQISFHTPESVTVLSNPNTSFVP